MNQRYKKGFRRLALALLIPWAIAWGAVFWINTDKGRRDAAEYDHAAMCMDTGCPDDKYDAIAKAWAVQRGISAAEMRHNEDDYLHKLSAKRDAEDSWAMRALWWGVGGPVAGVFAAVAFVWVWRGFRPRPISD
jgi:hypothetical protein